MAMRVFSAAGDHDVLPPREQTGPITLEACTIERWQGYRSSTFFASQPDGTLLHESSSFRIRGSEPPAEGPALAAYDEVVATLEELGWQRASDEPEHWYATRFVRAVATPLPTAMPDAPSEPDVGPPPAELAPAPVVAAAAPLVELAPAHVEVVPPPEAVELPAAPVQPAAAAPPSDDAPSQPRRRPRPVTLVAGAGVVVAVVAAVLGIAGYGKQSPIARTVVVQAGAAPAGHKARKPAASPSAPTPAATAPSIRVSIRATDAGSWLEVRKGSASGPVVFSGVLAAGQELHFSGPRFWSRFGAAGHLRITVNGRPLAFNGTYEHVFAPAKR